MEKMKVIGTITDKDFGILSKDLENPTIRYGARGIIFNSHREIAIFNKKNKNEFKIPGGGVEEDESFEVAFKREVLEETGCEVEITDFLGTFIEEKGLTNFKQISYIFVAEVTKDLNSLHLTKKEQEEGATLLWCSLSQASDLIENCIQDLKGSKYDDLYKSLFMVKRDSQILKYYINREKLNKVKL